MRWYRTAFMDSDDQRRLDEANEYKPSGSLHRNLGGAPLGHADIIKDFVQGSPESRIGRDAIVEEVVNRVVPWHGANVTDLERAKGADLNKSRREFVAKDERVKAMLDEWERRMGIGEEYLPLEQRLEEKERLVDEIVSLFKK